jgi:hypothetical protein
VMELRAEGGTLLSRPASACSMQSIVRSPLEFVYISSMAGPEAIEEEPSHSRDVDQLTLAIPFPLPHFLLM